MVIRLRADACPIDGDCHLQSTLIDDLDTSVTAAIRVRPAPFAELVEKVGRQVIEALKVLPRPGASSNRLAERRSYFCSCRWRRHRSGAMLHRLTSP